MKKSIKDVEFAFFSQLAYLNWNKLNINNLKNDDIYIKKNFMNFLTDKEKVWNKIKIDDLEPKVENGILMYDERDKRLFGVFGIERNKQEPEKIDPLYNFDGWQFIYSADKKKLFKEKYNLDIEDDGFFACAFMKDDDIIIAYRGTEPRTIKDLIADLEIGFLNHNHSQLVCTYIFLEHIKSIYPNKNINITGHSLGGCLAQYAFVCSDKQHKTVTWNALGLGRHKNKVTENIFFGNDVTNYLKLYSHDIKTKLEKILFTNTGKITDDFINFSEKQMIETIFNKLYFPVKNTMETGGHNIYETEVKGLKLSIGTMSSEKNTFEKNNLTHYQDKELEKELQLSSIQIYWLLKSIKNYQLSSTADSNKITNYYNSLDWAATLQTREGKCVDVLIGNELLNETTDDSKGRAIKNGIPNFDYHNINDFLLYMDNNGNIQKGNYNFIFSKNLVKTLYSHVLKEDLKRKDEDKYLKIFIKNREHQTNEKDVFKGFHIICCKKKIFAPSKKIIEEAKIKYIAAAEVSLSQGVHQYIRYREFPPEEKTNGSLEIGVYVIGHLSNIKNLGGIEGGVSIQLIKNGKIPHKIISNDEIIERLKNIPETRNIGDIISWGCNGHGKVYDIYRTENGTLTRILRHNNTIV